MPQQESHNIQRDPARAESARSAAQLGVAFGHLADAARGEGVCLMLVSSGGALLCHEDAGGPFFAQYVVRALAETPGAAELRRSLVAGLGTNSPPRAWDLVPGATLYAAPVAERRDVAGVLLVAARKEDFVVTAEIEQICGQLGIDPHWLTHDAQPLAPQPPLRLARDAALFAGVLADRLRIDSLEEELDSLSTQLANTYEELALIDRVSGGMRINRRSADFFRQACLDVMPVLNVRAIGFALHHEKVREAPSLFGEVPLSPEELRVLSEQFEVALMERKTPVLVNDIATDRRFSWMSHLARHVMAVPLLRRDEVLGCLFALDKREGDFNSVDAKLLTSIANESAIYLENAMLFGDVHDLMMGLLHSLTSAVDAKDAYTCGHSERVALLSRHLAAQTGLPDPEVERVYMAGLLHDVGKIGVPESVLQKTGKLTAEEFDQIKKHPAIGARILSDVKQLEDIIPGVLYHHERFDGKGYPTGLCGRDIPLMGRIICLADCFDAMTSSRTYRRAMPVEVALAEIRRCCGTQFDPELGELFLRNSPEELAALLADHKKQAKKLLELQETLRAA